MSSSVYVVKVSVRDDLPPFDLYGTGALIVSGTLALNHRFRGERLMSEGVDSVRTRRVHKQPPDLVMDITDPLVAGIDLATRETAYYSSEYRLCTLTTRFGGGTHVWKNVIIEQCEIVQRGFELIGAGSIANSTRTLVARWSFLRQQEAES